MFEIHSVELVISYKFQKLMFEPATNLKTDEDLSAILPQRDHSKNDLIIDEDGTHPADSKDALETINQGS